MADSLPAEDLRELLREITTVLSVPFCADYADREKRYQLLAHRAAELSGVLSYFAENAHADIGVTLVVTRGIPDRHPVTYRTDDQPGGTS